MVPIIKLPLFIVTGASGVGKSSICEYLFKNETGYIILESDILWHDIYNTPEDDYRKYRELWLRLCANISQAGKPVVLCGCATPQQFESCDGRSDFTEIHYLAITCDVMILENRMRNCRGITDENWIKSSVDFNKWLILNVNRTTPNMKRLDITDLSVEQAASIVDQWIHDSIE